ncbi:helix-turn-helix transcriptional regulator [Lentzea sp. NPDC006480]|uniref:helix-turn-helix transcriptional regulator n=1 Tax=Lentzea sp. NPDC006480 TaxID=3157176 RepID=UPI0033A6DD99
MAPPRKALTDRRKAEGFSRESLALAVGVAEKTVGKWERNEATPEPLNQPRLAKALRLTTQKLIDLLNAESEPEVQDGLDRVEWALANPSQADFETVARLRNHVVELGERYDRERSTALLAEAGQLLGQVRFLRQHAQRYGVKRDLLAAEAEAATLMGQFAWDASQRRDHLEARKHFDRAAEAAREINDPVLESIALLRTSYVALYGEDDARDGLRLTEQAAVAARGNSEVLEGLAVLHTAEAHAMLGERRACERALDLAQDHFEQKTGDDPVPEMFSETQHDRLAGACYLRLEDATKAQPTLERVAVKARSRSKSRSIALANLSLTHILQRDLEQAAASLHLAIDSIEGTWGGGGLKVIFNAARELRPWRAEPVIDQVYDRLLTVMAAT